MNKKVSTIFSKDSTFKMLISLFSVGAIYSFLCNLAVPYLHVTNAFVAAALSSYVISSFITFTFFYLNILPRLNKTSNEHYFIHQQIKGLNEVAIISTTDRSGKITYVNDNLCKISGYSRDELLGNSHRLIKSDLHSKDFYREMWKTISNGQIWQGQIKNKAKDGSDYWVFSNIIPLRNQHNGQIDEFISIRFDITNEKNLEIELENEQAKNIHMGRLAAIGEMAGSVAHEINNPIAVIMGKIHILKRQLEDVSDTGLREIILSKMHTIEDHAKRITKIVKGLREFSHGGDSNHQDEILSTQLFDSVLELCSEKIKTNGVKLKTKCSEIKFKSTKLHLEQVLINLINNGIDAIAENEEKWLELNLFETENHVHISVTDSGKGIPPELINKIMLPFFTTKPIGKGTGLGLSISKGLIEKMGGDFTYDTNSNNTCFRIIIPKSEGAIFSSLPYHTVINCLDKVRQKLEYRLKMDEIEKNKGEFSLRVAECPLPDWLMKYESRLGKNSDFVEIKTTYEQLRIALADIEWKYVNKTLSDELEIMKSKNQIETAISLLVQRLNALEEKMGPKIIADSEKNLSA